MKKNENYLIIRKVGLFYNAFDDDAIILNYLLDYKIINGRCGFPENAVNKVINILEDKKINYLIMEEEEKKQNFKNINQYSKYLAKAKDKLTLVNLIEEIKKKLIKMNEGQLFELLNKFKELIDEY